MEWKRIQTANTQRRYELSSDNREQQQTEKFRLSVYALYYWQRFSASIKNYYYIMRLRVIIIIYLCDPADPLNWFQVALTMGVVLFCANSLCSRLTWHSLIKLNISESIIWWMMIDRRQLNSFVQRLIEWMESWTTVFLFAWKMNHVTHGFVSILQNFHFVGGWASRMQYCAFGSYVWRNSKLLFYLFFHFLFLQIKCENGIM